MNHTKPLAVDRKKITKRPMTDGINTPSLEPAPLTALEAKWGDGIKAGFQGLPDALVRGQHLLGLTAIDMVVIANLNQAWWTADRLPFLTPHTIAKRMGTSQRTVQRSLSKLRQNGYVTQVRTKDRDGNVKYLHDMSGLCAAVADLARRDAQYSESLRSRTTNRASA